MKKKIYLAVLAACMTMTLSACGQDTVKKYVLKRKSRQRKIQRRMRTPKRARSKTAW